MSTLKSYTSRQTRNQDRELFDKTQIESILITKQKRISHVIILAETYQQLIAKLRKLEDLNLGKTAETIKKNYSMIESKKFTAILGKIANDYTRLITISII
ncbi:prevent-host-death protein [Geminocystis sp. NIES-3708]|uniref:prevent-host-death protein n=1 Tax=Geminocystis sp. NIES-3708 TaxID=1615909 RepID=UPI0005FCBFE6|nr:prevent-host-death protein [Geminocystis sp. NIES-3708]BAQ62198.1 prevent-host-death protein [Geminocystis sp. NIES-3708]